MAEQVAQAQPIEVTATPVGPATGAQLQLVRPRNESLNQTFQRLPRERPPQVWDDAVREIEREIVAQARAELELVKASKKYAVGEKIMLLSALRDVLCNDYYRVGKGRDAYLRIRQNILDRHQWKLDKLAEARLAKKGLPEHSREGRPVPRALM